MLLEGRNALVTGASRGIGRAIALEFARQGANVAILARDPQSLATVASEIRGQNRTCSALVADVRSRRDVHQAVDEAIESLGELDILVNNAGVGIGPVPVEDITDEQWQLIIGTDLHAPFMFCQEVAPHFIARRRGAIVNISSLAAKYKPGVTSAAYAAAKAGLCAITRQLAVKLGPHGIRVNAVLPGNTVLEQSDKSWASLSPEDRAALLKRIPLGRFGHPDDQAKLVVWLASDQNTWVTGETIGSSGGELMG